jgi:hypothetical protein
VIGHGLPPFLLRYSSYGSSLLPKQPAYFVEASGLSPHHAMNAS